ncbi:MAG: AAA family ATPase [Ignavibacteriales bacterium]|nr:AAA family ATPase [Ignavibacteriales bacterium]
MIDEYDKPIVDNLGNVDLAEKNKLALREFYSVIKSLDEYIKFMFVTGVSKFTKVSLFSGLNQISEII